MIKTYEPIGRIRRMGLIAERIIPSRSQLDRRLGRRVHDLNHGAIDTTLVIVYRRHFTRIRFRGRILRLDGRLFIIIGWSVKTKEIVGIMMIFLNNENIYCWLRISSSEWLLSGLLTMVTSGSIGGFLEICDRILGRILGLRFGEGFLLLFDSACASTLRPNWRESSLTFFGHSSDDMAFYPSKIEWNWFIMECYPKNEE